MSKDKLTKPSEGFFLASRRVQASLSGRIKLLDKEISKLRKESSDFSRVLAEIEILEKTRKHLRNTLLWDTRDGI